MLERTKSRIHTSKADTVILGTTLSDGHDYRLMVGSRGHGAKTVVTSRETTGYICRQKTLAISGVVDTLEEGELGSIQRRGRVKLIAQVLNSHVGVANNVTAAIQVLGSRVVRVIGISECTGSEVSELDLDAEVLVGLDVVVVLWVDDDG